MSSCVEKSLLRVASSTFEELGFMLPDPDPSEEQRSAALDGAVGVGFDGPFAGRLELRVCGGVLPLLTDNMLGGGADLTADLQADALGEVANVICGNLLPLLAGTREVFRLEAPRPVEPAPGTLPAHAAMIGLEQGCAEVLLYLPKDVCLAEVAA